MVLVSYKAIIINYGCVFSVRKENISPGEKWRVSDIYQIVVSKNGFASLDQRPHISTHHRQFCRNHSRYLECMFWDWVGSLTDCFSSRSQYISMHSCLYTVHNKTKAQKVYKKPTEKTGARMKLQAACHVQLLKLCPTQVPSLHPTYLAVYLL